MKRAFRLVVFGLLQETSGKEMLSNVCTIKLPVVVCLCPTALDVKHHRYPNAAGDLASIPLPNRFF